MGLLSCQHFIKSCHNANFMNIKGIDNNLLCERNDITESKNQVGCME